MSGSWRHVSLLSIGLVSGACLLFLLSLTWDVIVQRHLKRLPQVEASLLPEAQELAKQEIATKIAQQQLLKNQTAIQSQYLPRYAAVKFYVIWGTLGVLFVGISGSMVVFWIVYWKRHLVYTYKLGDNEIVVPDRELPQSTTIALGLITAEQLKQENSGLNRAFELYCTMADTQTKWITALGKHRPMLTTGAAGDVSSPIPLSQVPTFADLLQTDLTEGKPMILGFTQDGPRYGTFLDIYSSAIAGDSGSGKTSTMIFLIASGLITQGVRYYQIDPHYPHPKSLGFKTKRLWEAGLMRHATYKDDMLKILREVEGIIDARLRQEDTDTTPVVLVVDELAFLGTTSIGPELTRVMERISTEGRKCQVYLLASSQTWLVSRTGKDSVARDTLTSAFVHRIKPKQATLLLQDKTEVEKVKHHIKKAGQVLLCPVNDESVICQIPKVEDEDMEQVKAIVNGTNVIPFPVHPAKGYDATLLSKEIMLQARKKATSYERFYQSLSESSHVSVSLIKQICLGQRKLTPDTAQKLAPFL